MQYLSRVMRVVHYYLSAVRSDVVVLHLDEGATEKEELA